jgi:hypothetical protein
MVEWLRCHKEYLPRPSKFEGFLDHICIYTRPGTMTDSKVSDMRFSRYPKGTIKRKSSRIPKATSSRLIKRSTTPMVGLSHLSQGGSKNKQLVRSQMSPTSLKYLKWSEVPLPSIAVKDVKLNRVLIDGSSSLNILFLKTFDQMGLSRYLLCPSRAPFNGIVLGAATNPVSHIVLPVTFGTQENFCMENI